MDDIAEFDPAQRCPRRNPLIDDGYLAGRPVRDLAAEFGVGERHMNPLFRAELGATPKGLARMRRIALAKRLIDDTNLTMTDVARAAGYGSVRRFNDEFLCVFGRAPLTVRRRRTAQSPTDICLRLPTRGPFNADWVFGFLARRALPDLETVDGHTYRRRIDDRFISVSLRDDALWLNVPGALADQTANILARVRRMFDLDADTDAIGIGPWTAEYVAMRVARDPDAFPASDWAVRKVLGSNERCALHRAERWRTWRSYAVMHLWRASSADVQRGP